jgi:hypothetical protein
MTLNKTSRLTLLITSALISASSAMAQTAPNGTWTVASISNTATNSGTIAMNGNIVSPAITTGTGGSVTGSAVGATGSDSINFATSGLETAPSEQRTVATTTTLAGTNSGAVTATVNVQGATISAASVSGSASASAVGGVGSLTISSVNSATYANQTTGGATPAVSTNNATYTGAVNLTGTNSGATTFTGNIGTTNNAALGATIVGGTNNGISSSAVGAAGSLSYSNVVTAVNNDTDPAAPASSNETVVFSAAVTVLGDNNVGGNVLATTSIFDAQIDAGTGNSISGAAVGASGSVSLSSNGGTSSSSNNSVTFGAALNVTGDNANAATVTVAGDLGSSTNLAADDPVITAGNNNSISLAGVGASGSLSYSGIQTGSLSQEDYTVTGVATVLGTNTGAVTVGTATNAETVAGIYGGTVAAGNGNGISVAAVGASGSISLNSVVNGGTPDTTVTFTGGLNVDGLNAGAVALASQIGLTNGAANKPTIAAGNGNSISVAAVGASGSVSYSDVQLTGTASEQFLIPGTVMVDGTNNAAGTVTATGSVFGGTISGGNANSISVAAVGASGSVSADSLVIAGVPDNTLTFGSTVAVVGANNAAVSLTGNLGSTANVANDSPSITGGVSNSISLTGVGASASVSFSNTSVSGADGSNNYSIAGATTITADNNAIVGVTGTVYGGAISGGTGNGISVAAVGSSAAFSSNSIVEGSGSVPTTSLSTSTVAINSDNSANITLTGAVGLIGAATASDPTISGVDTVTASISSSAVGASGSLSVTNLLTGGATPDEKVTIGATTFNIDNTANVTVTAGGIFGGTISGGTGGSISQAAVGASGSASFTNIVAGASTLAPGATEYVVGAQGVVVDNTGTVSITGDIGTTDLANNASITGGVNNSISVSGVGASGSTSFSSMFSAGTTASSGAGVYAIAALTHSVTNTGGVTVASNSYGATIGGGVGSSISAAAVGASATTNFTVITRSANTGT